MVNHPEMKNWKGQDKLGWPKNRVPYSRRCAGAFSAAQWSAGRTLEAEWRGKLQAYQTFFPKKHAELERRLGGSTSG